VSPRAAWRLEAAGIGPVYGYLAGKSGCQAMARIGLATTNIIARARPSRIHG
jgi:hypothetical protein